MGTLSSHPHGPGCSGVAESGISAGLDALAFSSADQRQRHAPYPSAAQAMPTLAKLALVRLVLLQLVLAQ